MGWAQRRNSDWGNRGGMLFFYRRLLGNDLEAYLRLMRSGFDGHMVTIRVRISGEGSWLVRGGRRGRLSRRSS